MAKSKKEKIEITEEGIIIIDDLVADFEYLYNKIKTKSCIIVMLSKESYLNLLVPFEHWLSEKVSEDEFKEIVAFIKNEWQQNLRIQTIIDEYHNTIKIWTYVSLTFGHY